MYGLSLSLRGPITATVSRSKRLPGVVGFREKSTDWDSRRTSSSGSNSSNSSSSLVQQHAKRDFLEARQVSLYELFDGNAFLLDIPDYQRPYAWRAKQVRVRHNNG